MQRSYSPTRNYWQTYKTTEAVRKRSIEQKNEYKKKGSV